MMLRQAQQPIRQVSNRSCIWVVSVVEPSKRGKIDVKEK